MDQQRLQAITNKLDEFKARGEAADYLIRCIGTPGHLIPRVTVWNRRTRFKAWCMIEVSRLLSDLVAPNDIEILAE